MKRPEAEGAVSSGVDDAVQAQRRTQAVLHHQGGVVEQAVTGHDVQRVEPSAKPVLQGACILEAAGDDEGKPRVSPAPM